MTENPKTKPCPFCGHEWQYVYKAGPGERETHFMCACGADVWFSRVGGDAPLTEAEAIERYDRRAEEERREWRRELASRRRSAERALAAAEASPTPPGEASGQASS